MFMSTEAFIAACTGSTTTTGTPVKGGHLIEGSDSDVGALNPLLWNDTPSLIASNMLFDGLLTSTADGEAGWRSPDLPTVSADGKSYTFNLRQDAKWTDGTPVTSDDVVFTYKVMFDPAYKDFPFSRRAQAEQNIDSVTAPDKYTVVITTKKVYAPLILQFGMWGLMPAHVLGQLNAKDLTTAPFNQNPNVTNGVFKFVKWEKGNQISFARNDTLVAFSYLDTYVFKVLGSGTAWEPADGMSTSVTSNPPPWTRSRPARASTSRSSPSRQSRCCFCSSTPPSRLPRSSATRTSARRSTRRLTARPSSMGPRSSRVRSPTRSIRLRRSSTTERPTHLAIA
jgi:ABC-type transport system substrate-binding protein